MNDSRLSPRRRSLLGPLLIVAIGVVALLVNMGRINGPDLFWWFSKYWPVLLIFWGAVKFAEYFWARRRNEPAPRIGAGGVVLLIFLTLTGLVSSGLAHVNWSFVDLDPRNDWQDPLGIFGTRYEFTAKADQPMLTGNQIKILSSRGDITVKPSPDGQAHAVMHKYIRTRSQDEANQFNNFRPGFQQQSDVWVLDLNLGSLGQKRVDVELQLPPNVAVSLANHRGVIHISQIEATVDAETDRGNIDAEQITGNVSLRVSHGNVTVKNITGNVSVQGDVSEGDVLDVTGSVNFNGSYVREVQLAHIRKQVEFKSSVTHLDFTKLDGELFMNRWNIHGDGLAGPLVLTTETKNIHLQDVTGNVHVVDDTGDIDMQTKAPLGDIDLRTTHGQISIGLPETAGFQMDAESDEDGRILSDYNLNINNDRHNATATGSVGNAKSHLKLRTNRGTIQIRKE